MGLCSGRKDIRVFVFMLDFDKKVQIILLHFFSLIARIWDAGDSLSWRGEFEGKEREKQLLYIKHLCSYSIKCQN